ncbi:MAG: Holliday junction resolvase RuvX [Candidatus Dasytiphilus stammeri]
MPKIKILLGFDFGIRHIGVAIGQTLTNTASPLLPSIKANKGLPDWRKVKKLILEWCPDKIIVGLPINMDGSEQLLTIHTRIFAKKLFHHFSIPVDLYDERLTTIEAKNKLFINRGYRGLKKNHIDSFAAVLILESFLLNLQSG